MIGAIVGKSHMWGLGSTIAMLVFFAFLIVLAITHHNPVTYPSDDQSLTKYHEDQCERPADKGWMVEVENTLSNVGYMFAGVFVLFRAGSWAGHLLALNLVLLSIMSGIYHGTLAETPQQLDVAWVYAALLALSTYVSFVQARAERPFDVSRWVWIGFATGWVILALLMLVLFQVTGLVALVALTLVIGGISGLCLLTQKAVPQLVWVITPVTFVAIPPYRDTPITHQSRNSDRRG